MEPRYEIRSQQHSRDYPHDGGYALWDLKEDRQIGWFRSRTRAIEDMAAWNAKCAVVTHPAHNKCGYTGCKSTAVLFGRLICPAGEPVYRCKSHTGHHDFTHARRHGRWVRIPRRRQVKRET